MKFPHAGRNRAWLYLVFWKSGVLKVGITSNPVGRMQTHGRAEWRHYCGFGSRGFMLHVEGTCVGRFKALGKPVRPSVGCEEFRGIDQATAIRIAREVLAESRPMRAEIEAHFAARRSEKAWAQFRAGLFHSSPAIARS